MDNSKISTCQRRRDDQQFIRDADDKVELHMNAALFWMKQAEFLRQKVADHCRECHPCDRSVKLGIQVSGRRRLRTPPPVRPDPPPAQTTAARPSTPAAPRQEPLLDGGLCAEGRYLLDNGAPLSPGFLFFEHAQSCETCHKGNVAVYSMIEALEAEF